MRRRLTSWPWGDLLHDVEETYFMTLRRLHDLEETYFMTLRYPLAAATCNAVAPVLWCGVSDIFFTLSHCFASFSISSSSSQRATSASMPASSSPQTVHHHRKLYIITTNSASSTQTLHHHHKLCIITTNSASSTQTLHHRQNSASSPQILHHHHKLCITAKTLHHHKLCIITTNSTSSPQTLHHHHKLYIITTNSASSPQTLHRRLILLATMYYKVGKNHTAILSSRWRALFWSMNFSCSENCNWNIYFTSLLCTINIQQSLRCLVVVNNDIVFQHILGRKPLHTADNVQRFRLMYEMQRSSLATDA